MNGVNCSDRCRRWSVAIHAIYALPRWIHSQFQQKLSTQNAGRLRVKPAMTSFAYGIIFSPRHDDVILYPGSRYKRTVLLCAPNDIILYPDSRHKRTVPLCAICHLNVFLVYLFRCTIFYGQLKNNLRSLQNLKTSVRLFCCVSDQTTLIDTSETIYLRLRTIVLFGAIIE